MKARFNNNRFIITTLLLALAGALPQLSMAQRFNHGGGGAPSRPAFNPAPRQAAPSRPAFSPAPRQAAPSRPQEVRPVPAQRPAETENRTINGGSRNIGNHDFNRNANDHAVNDHIPNANVHENVTIRQNADVHGNIPGRPGAVDVHQHVNVRDHENVFHTGAYRGIHPYYYHPYRPSYWGPNWHPLGFFLSSLAADAVFFSIANQRYYYDDGVYYEPSNGGYSVVPPPVGAVVGYLPQGYETTMVGNDTYYYYGGAFYISNGQGYQVVPAPPGAVIVQLPVGAIEQQINGDTYLVYNNTYFQPISQDGQDAYEVVTPN